MKIQWLGHSSFRIVDSEGTSIVTDPYHSYVGYSMPNVACDAVTISHNHDDHNYVKAVKGSPVIFDKKGEFKISNIKIKNTYAYHDNEKGEKRGKVLVFKIKIDGISVCHFGDIGEDCNSSLIDLLVPINILFIPVGGIYTIDAVQAKKYIEKIKPNIVIPMHFKSKNCVFDIANLEQFLVLFNKDEVVYLNSDVVEFTRNDFNCESTKIYVFKSMYY